MRDMNSLDKNSLEYAIKQLSATFAAVHGVKVVHDYENQYAPVDIDVQRRKLYHAELARREGNNEPLITYQEWFDDHDKTWIYESPDKGNTVYRRKFFESPETRELVDNGKGK